MEQNRTYSLIQSHNAFTIGTLCKILLKNDITVLRGVQRRLNGGEWEGGAAGGGEGAADLPRKEKKREFKDTTL